MKKLIFILFVCFVNRNVFSQKPSIDFKAIEKWPLSQYAGLSNDGKYVYYNMTSDTRNLDNESDKVVIQSSETGWKYEIAGVNHVSFSSDSKYAIYLKSDTLDLVTLGKRAVEHIPLVESFQLEQHNKKEWLAYQLKNEERELVLKDLRVGEKHSYMNVEMYKFSTDGNVLLVKTNDDLNNVNVQWIRLENLQMTNIWKGKNVKDFVFSNGQQLAFIGLEDNAKATGRTIWYYKSGLAKASILADEKMLAIDSNIYLGGLFRFSDDGTRLFFSYKERQHPKPEPNPNPNAVMVDVWNYLDPRILSDQPNDLPVRSYTAVINLGTKGILRLENPNEQFSSRQQEQLTDIYGLVMSHQDVPSDEERWNSAGKTDNYLVSTIDGSKRKLNSNRYFFSAHGKYLVKFDVQSNQYYAYDIASGKENCISAQIPSQLSTRDDQNVRLDPHSFGVAGWLAEDKAVLIYDEFDIWEVDLHGENAPVNITNGYGRRHRIQLRFMLEPYKPKVLSEYGTAYLTGFSYDTKDNGFFILNFGKKTDPKLLTFGPYVYYAPQSRADDENVKGRLPIKAKNANVYLVTRESAEEHRNYFITRDFKAFHRVSSFYPEQGFNWLTTELYNWRSLDGHEIQGILYKPQNFDSSKKYPLIIHYYETKSDGLNAYKEPSLSNGAINIPYYVSNGYLVFTLDFRYQIGDPMQGVYDAAVSAANYLKTLPFVNSSKLGIQGWSFGGFETNYLVTHTSIFAAAAETAGYADLISSYNNISIDGRSLQGAPEEGQNRMGGTLWEKPQMYIKNSPIFNADKVSTPVLIMHNKNDGAVSFSQGIEMFLALRRLGKKAWMLQYDGQGHGVHGKASEDFTIRLMQFFDHYLKDKPAPVWMTRGIPARLKGIETGLEPDTEIKTPPEGGLLTPEEKKKVDALLNRQPITITIK